VTTILSGASSKTSHLLLVPLVYTENGWTVKEEEIKAVAVQVCSGYTLTVITAYPRIVVNFDGEDFQTGADGHLALNATPGYHLISVDPIVTVNNSSRLIFQQWNGTLGSSHLSLAVSGDMTLFAIYRRQYHLDVSSRLGQATGTGWYDENSSALFYVTPIVVIDNVTNVFARWSGDSNDSSPSSILFMNGSKEVHASWRELKSVQSNPSPTHSQVLLALCSIMLLASIIFVVLSARRNYRTFRSLK
jgi:hypothetical protein